MKKMTAIDWPNWWKKSRDKRYFLEGMPYFGPAARIIREAKKEVKSRSYLDAFNAWSDIDDYCSSTSRREDVFKVVKNYINWPNHNFIPEDKAAIVLGFLPGIWIDCEDVLDDILLLFKIDKSNINIYLSCQKSIMEGSLKDLFILLDTILKDKN